jgi:hypothetical protein
VERAGGLEAAPYHPRNLFNLFFRPSRFFASIPLDRRNVSRDLAIFLYGVYRFYGELNEEYLRAAFGRPRAAWTELDKLLAGSWTAFWLLAIPMGLLAGYLAWWISGWWFKIRLKWSGENSPDPVRARMTFAYSTLVASLPVLAHLMVKMVRYSSYSEAYKSGSPLSMFLMIFPLWSILVGYAGATTAFRVHKGKSLFWFLILPAGVYLLSMCLLLALIVMGG